MKRLLLIALLLLTSRVYPQAWSGILAPSRAITWEGNVGVPGGIPSATWTNCTTAACNTVNSGTVTAASINAAINSAPANSVIRIPAGTFTFSASAFSNGHNNFVLRGAGPLSTKIILNGNNILLGLGTAGQGNVPSGALSVTNLSTLAKGSTTLTVASTTGLSPGMVVQIDQLNDTSYVNINGDEGVENAGRCASPLSFSGCSTRAQLELVKILTVPDSTHITIDAPGLSHDYISGLSPQVFFWATAGGSVSFNGIENITVDAGDGSAGHAKSDFAVSMDFCNYCWTKNLTVINGHRSAIYSLWSYRDEVRDSYVSESNTAGAPTEYGIEFDTVSMSKIENNILFGITSPINLETSYGIVMGYNYMLNTSSGDQFPNIDTHRVQNFLELAESNVEGTLAWDMIWGGGSQNTAFRERPNGNDPNKTNFRLPIAISAWNRYANVVDSVLGDTTFHLTYQCTPTTSQPANNFIYQIGFFNRCDFSPNGTDVTTLTTSMRWGNWDAVTYCTNGGHGGTACGGTGSNGIRFCTASGTGNAACTVDERGNLSGTYPALTSPATTFPPTFYNGSNTPKPSCGTGLSFWKDPITNLCPQYPAMGGDVTAVANIIPNAGGHASKIPAQLCYEKTTKNAGGFLTAFDAAQCYTADTAGPPTVVSITVVPNPAAVTTATTVNLQTGAAPPASSYCTFSDTSRIAAGATGCVVTWTGTNAHSSVSSVGVVTGISVGSDTITATLGAVSGNGTVNVSAVGPVILQKKFIDCHLGCTNQVITPTSPTTAGSLLVIAQTSSVPITNIQGGGVWSPLYSGMITNSDVVQWVSLAFMLNAPAMSTITVTQATWTGGIEFYEISGANAVDTSCIKQLATPLATSTSKSVTCTNAHAQEIIIGALAGAPNTPTISGSLAVDSTLAGNNSIFASASESSTGTYSFGGTWASGSGRPTITMASFYKNTLPTAVKPILSPGTGNYGPSQSVAMKTPTVGGVIHYAINATPTCASTTYTTPVAVTVSETLAAITCAAAGYNNSAVTTNVYGITGRLTPVTWYVRQDGAGLFTTARATTGGSSGPFTGSAIGCDGQADVSYAAAGGTGTQTNLHCAVNDFRYLFDPQTFNNSNPNTWTPQGSDTIIIRGCATNADQSGNTTAPQCRMGYDNNTGPGHGSTWCFGGGVNGCANPPIPSGTPSQHTRILGQNFAACSSQASMTYLFGGFGLGAVLDLSGAQYVDVECLNITRNGNCIQHGTPAVPSNCGTPSSPVNDYASDGFHGTIATHDVLVQDAWVHGFPDRGWKGPIGGLVDCERCNFDTNGEAGWDFDDGSGSAPDVFGGFTGVGTASVNGDWRFNFSIMQWSGCNQEYPFVHAIPVVSCYSQNNAGYGDGVGGPPGQSIAATVIGSWFLYNVQDAIDLGHNDSGPSGAGYSDQTTAPYLIQNSYAYGNSGAAWKAGPNTNPLKILNTLAIGNCSVLSSTITGTNPTYNANLGDYCRSGSLLSLNFHSLGTMTISNNTFITYFGTAFLIQAWEGPFADPGTTLNFQNNITYGLQNAVPNSTFPSGQDYGANNGGIGGFFFNTGLNPAEAIGTNNRTNNQWFGVRNITCSFTGEICSDPLFVNEWPPCLVSGGAGCTFTEQTWTILRLTAIGGPASPSFNLTNVSPAIGAGVNCSATGCLSTDFNGNAQTVPPTDGAVVFLAGPGTVATPTSSPAPGSFVSPQNVSLFTATSGATICFTTDGSTPTAVTAGTCSHGTTYVGPINVSISTTITAIGTKAGSINSVPAAFTFTINTPSLFNSYTIGNSYKGGRVVIK